MKATTDREKVLERDACCNCGVRKLCDHKTDGLDPNRKYSRKCLITIQDIMDIDSSFEER